MTDNFFSSSSSSCHRIDPSTTPLPAAASTHPFDSRPRFQNATASSNFRPGPAPATSSAATTSNTTSTAAASTPPHDTQAGPQNPQSSRRRSTLPSFSFPFFQLSSNPSVTSLVPSTAEGKPIPLDDSTAAHRTSALRELNSNFPSPVARHRYTKSSGPQSSTYSQPVIVRTYSGPTASHGRSRSNSHAARRRGPPSTTSTSISYVSPVAHSRPAAAQQNGGVLTGMGRGKAKKLAWPWRQGHEQETPADRLPPYEAYSFKTIMANLQAQSNEVDRALDGIAEIYARSRYSLSNQYEVHVAPHGSGASFISAVPSSSSSSFRRRGHTRNSHSQSGLTLQAIQSDDDDTSASARSRRKRRNTGRRRSAAHSTLETIMSSSRSSEEDKTKKKSAAELASEVRGRTASNSGRSGAGSRSPQTGNKDDAVKPEDALPKKVTRERSKSFANAIIYADTAKNQVSGEGSASPRTSSAALVSEPSMPQTSTSHLEIRTTPNELLGNASTQGSHNHHHLDSPDGSDPRVTQLLQSLAPREDTSSKPSSSGIMSWVTWKSSLPGPGVQSQPGLNSAASPSHAEGSLRELLKNVEGKTKGKLVERLD